MYYLSKLITGLFNNISQLFSGRVSALSFYNSSIDKDFYIGPLAQIGCTAELQFGKWFEIRPSIFLNTNGNFGSDFYTPLITINNVYFPIDLLATIRKLSGFAFFFGMGPYVSYSFSGRTRFYNPDSLGNYVENISDIKLGNGQENNLKPFDYGINLKIGMQARNNIFINFSFNYGIANRTPYSDVNNGGWKKIKSMQLFTVGFGYLLGPKEKNMRKNVHKHYNRRARHYRR